MTAKHQLDIGTTEDGKAFRLPVDLVTETTAILAKRGVGKTHTASVMAEELLAAGQQTVVVDPLDVWWGLRSSAGGKEDGYPIVVFGGEHADVPLAQGDGVNVAELVVAEQVPAILSTRHLSKKAQTQFVADFAERLYELKGKGKNRTPLHLILDEADAFAPQKPWPGAERMLGAVEDLVRRGRSSGIGVTLITQRAAVINKDVLTQTEVLIAMRNTSPQDRKAVEDWIKAHDVEGQHDAFMASLAALPIGTAWFWSPGWLNLFSRVKVRARRTFDSSRTPKVGEKPIVPKKLADIDIPGIKARLSAAIAEAEANDPRKLKAELAAARKEIAQLEARSHQATKPRRDEELSRIGQMERRLRTLDGAVLVVWERQADVGERVQKLRDEVGAAIDHLKEVRGSLLSVDAIARDKKALTKSSRSEVNVDMDHDVNRNGRVLHLLNKAHEAHCPKAVASGAPRRIMRALAQHGQLTDGALAIIADVPLKASTFRNTISKLRTAGHLTGGGGGFEATKEGLQCLGDFEPLPYGDDLRRYWQGKFGDSAVRRIFDAVCEAYPKAIGGEKLAEAADVPLEASTFRNTVSKLRTLQLISGRGDELLAADCLFGAG